MKLSGIHLPTLAISSVVLIGALTTQHLILKRQFSTTLETQPQVPTPVTTGNATPAVTTHTPENSSAESDQRPRISFKSAEETTQPANPTASEGPAQKSSRRLATATVAANFSTTPRAETAQKLRRFVDNIAATMTEEDATAVREGFEGLLQRMSADTASISIEQRREDALDALAMEISSATGKGHLDRLEKRVAAITGTPAEELDPVLTYYERLDDISDMNALLKRYNIAREELRLSNIEPPPRNSWGPDALEIAMNLDTFSQLYTPLIATEKREKFQHDVDNYLHELTRLRTNKEAEEQRGTWLRKMEADLAKVGEDDKNKRKWLERRINGLEKASHDDIRKWMQWKQLGGVRELAATYEIPHNELVQSGAMFKRRH